MTKKLLQSIRVKKEFFLFLFFVVLFLSMFQQTIKVANSSNERQAKKQTVKNDFQKILKYFEKDVPIHLWPGKYEKIIGKAPGYFGPHQAKINFAEANYDYYKNLIDGFHKLKEILPKSLKFSDLSGSISRSSLSSLTLPQIKSLAAAMAQLLKGMEVPKNNFFIN